MRSTGQQTQRRRLSQALRLLSPDPEQDLHRQLIEAFVPEPALTACAELGDQALNLGISVPSGGTFLQDQVRAHAAAREVADAIVVFSTVGMRIEVPRAGVADLFEKLHQPERGLDVRR